ncbi:hypothetical protein [Streptomyces venezuelae]|uniref:hypothetical protein n=1 Tax=Streptomyces venezuelae TaxID=54571 RepID=UPI003657A2B7
MHGAWTAFVRDLDPGAGRPRSSAARGPFLLWDADALLATARRGSRGPVTATVDA